MELKDIQNLIRFIAKSEVSEVKLKMKDIKITVRTSSGKSETTIVQQPPVGAILPQQVAPTPVAQETVSSDTSTQEKTKDASVDNYQTITSPMIGTFYRRPSPDKPIFVEVGDRVSNGDIVCVIEAMKLFNDIQSDFSGKIVKVLVDDASPVEFGTPLFLVEPC